MLDHVAPGVFDDPLDPAMTVAFLADRRHHIVVAVDDGRVVGFVSGVHYLHPDKAVPELWLNEVAVAPTHRRQGLARAMVAAMLGVGRDLGCTEAWVLTERSNPAAMRLYGAAGGVAAPEDEVMFSFDLTAPEG